MLPKFEPAMLRRPKSSAAPNAYDVADFVI